MGENAFPMRIRSIEVNDFKSLVGFRLDLAKYNCLIGLNGSGKSTVLQFFDFLAQQMRGDLSGWLDVRGWKASEVLSRLSTGKTVTFKVTAADRNESISEWKGTYNPSRLRCTVESLVTPDAELFVKGGSYSIRYGEKKESEKISFTFQGSILSQLRPEVLPKSLVRFKEFLSNTESLDMLTPERLRQRTREAQGTLGHGGRHLAAFVYELGDHARKELLRRLKLAYPRLHGIGAVPLRSGWKQLFVSERYNGERMRTEARHVNDGLLRLLAILAELTSDHEFLLFDEIENGINPELVEFVTDALVEAKQQVIVTTHSPMILNYLDDQTAQEAVIYLYKTSSGHTRTIPFFSIPSLKKKLSVMGPGEAFVDTDLALLAEEIERMEKES
jgi:predicted ATPase